MGTLLDVVVAYLDQEEFEYHVESDERVELSFTTSNGVLNTWFSIDEEDEIVLYVTRCPVFVPEERRVAAMEFLTRATFGLRIGNFELDLEDGEVRYKTSLDVEGDRLSPALLQRIVRPNLATMNRYLPGLLRVVYGATAPADEIAAIEG
ncbi:MAG TPA: YbjN domain-containing protein [Kineosporiaceae bacterium]|jgi:hypothetical protein|nr:YbjN domain-containing protein [Kineosporiaceae bacterium]